MTIKKVFVSFLTVAFLSAMAGAEKYEIPRDVENTNPGDIDLVGVDVLVDTGVSAIGSTVPFVLYGYSVSSDALTNFAMLRDSNTLNTTSNIKLTLYPDAYCTTGVQTCTAKFPAPLIFRNGLSINLQSAVVNAGVGSGLGSKGRWMFFGRYRDYGNKPGSQHPFAIDNVGVN